MENSDLNDDMKDRKKWKFFSGICVNCTWTALVVWLAANIISQVIFFIKYREPYDGVEMLKTLGNWYWLIFGLEIILWAVLGALLIKKAKIKLEILLDQPTDSP